MMGYAARHAPFRWARGASGRSAGAPFALHATFPSTSLTEPRIALLEVARCLSCGADDAAPLTVSRAQMSARADCFSFVRCRVCDLVYLCPRVREDEIGEWYGPDYLPYRGDAAWGRYAPFAAEGQRRTDAARVAWTRRAASPTPGSVVLDVGCGRPTFLELLHRRAGTRGVGLDLSDAGWRDDLPRWRTAGLELHQGRLEEVSLEGGFDTITLWHALEHDYRPLNTLRRLRGLARAGATLIVEVPDHDGLTRRLQGPTWAGYHTPRHTAVYTRATLRALLERAGWRVLRQARYGTLDPYVLWWLGRRERAGWRTGEELEKRFPWFMAGKLATLPLVAMQRWIRMGVQVAVGGR
jgi:SAM-dependent methyltransferase